MLANTVTRLICVIGAAAIAVLGLCPEAHAATITFDGAFTSPNTPIIDPPPNDFSRSYFNNTGTLVFTTQGFNFGGLGTAGTGDAGSLNSVPAPELFIMMDATACSVALDTACAPGDGTDYLVPGDRFSLIVTGSASTFALASLQASQLFGPNGCVECSDDGSSIPNPFSIRVRGFRAGALQADETFALSGAFQTFSLSDPDFANISRVVFDALDSQGNAINGETLYGIDNVNATAVTAVPEPASLLLLGTGVVALARRRLKQRT
jgi:hypothetical protein